MNSPSPFCSDERVSSVGLGAWEAGGGRTWGPNAGDDDVVRALRTGFDLGATWIDTAEVYAKGRSEEIVGRAVRGCADVMVFTKVAPRPDGTGVRGAEVARAAEGSLRRLGRDDIDLYQVHWRDHDVPIEETWAAMGSLVDRGLCRWIGLSNVAESDVRRCATLRRVDALQVQGSLLHCDELDWALPLCATLGIGVICYGPLAYGLLSDHPADTYTDWRSGTYGMDDFFVAENHARFFAPDVLPRHRRRAAAVGKVAAELGVTAAQAALAWLLARPGVTGAIAGSRSATHIAENIAAGRIRFTETDLARIETAGRQ